jgi:hypothetical protein
MKDSSRPRDLLEVGMDEFIGVAGRLNAKAQRIAPADCNWIRTTNWPLGYTRSLKSSRNWSSSWTMMNRMTTNQTTNRNSRSLKCRPRIPSRLRSWMTTIRSCCQSRGDATSQNCPRSACRRHRYRPGVRRFLRHHAWADYVRPVVKAAELSAAPCTVAPCTVALCKASLDICRLDSNHCGGNSRCRMSWFGAVQP